jgi:hypothetical protein
MAYEDSSHPTLTCIVANLDLPSGEVCCPVEHTSKALQSSRVMAQVIIQELLLYYWIPRDQFDVQGVGQLMMWHQLSS